MKATFIKKMGREFNGDARLYRVEPPIEYEKYDSDNGEYKKYQTDYVVVSAADVMFSGPETYIFASDEKGEIKYWGELSGSRKGVLDHHYVLREAGVEDIKGE